MTFVTSPPSYSWHVSCQYEGLTHIPSTCTALPRLHPWTNHGSSLFYCHEENQLCCFFN